MAIENDPSGRMQIRPRSQLLHPGACMVCGNGTCDDGYLDLDVFIDYEGKMYLCLTCAIQAGEVCGMFTRDQVDTQQNLMNTIQTNNERLAEELEDAKRTIDSLNDLLRSRYLPSSDSGSSVSSFVEESENSDDQPTLPFDGPENRESESEESVTVPRLTDVSRSESRDIKFL